MAAAPRYACLRRGASSLTSQPSLRAPQPSQWAAVSRRALATAVGEPGSTPTPTPTSSTTKPPRPRTKFSDRLNSGPSLGDFVGGGPKEEALSADEMLELRTAMVGPAGKKKQITRLPEWLKTPIPGTSENYKKIRNDLRGLNLHTVCEEARCPNIGDCWGGSTKSAATATIMLMGDTCTRGCRFCSVKTNRRPPPLDPHEPENTAEALKRWGLGYVVLTSVDRDDLADGGARHFAETITRIKQKAPAMLVEALTGDYMGDLEMVGVVARSGLDVYAHNVETTEALTPYVRDRRATFRQSLRVLEAAKAAKEGLITKTSMMLGLGETDEQIYEALKGEFLFLWSKTSLEVIMRERLTGRNNRTQESQRRRRHLRSVHAPHKAPHECRGVRHARQVRALASARPRHGLPLLCFRPARPLVVQGRRGVHRECAQEEGG